MKCVLNVLDGHEWPLEEQVGMCSVFVCGWKEKNQETPPCWGWSGRLAENSSGELDVWIYGSLPALIMEAHLWPACDCSGSDTARHSGNKTNVCPQNLENYNSASAEVPVTHTTAPTGQAPTQPHPPPPLLLFSPEVRRCSSLLPGAEGGAERGEPSRCLGIRGAGVQAGQRRRS